MIQEQGSHCVAHISRIVRNMLFLHNFVFVLSNTLIIVVIIISNRKVTLQALLQFVGKCSLKAYRMQTSNPAGLFYKSPW